MKHHAKFYENIISIGQDAETRTVTHFIKDARFRRLRVCVHGSMDHHEKKICKLISIVTA